MEYVKKLFQIKVLKQGRNCNVAERCFDRAILLAISGGFVSCFQVGEQKRKIRLPKKRNQKAIKRAGKGKCD